MRSAAPLTVLMLACATPSGLDGVDTDAGDTAPADTEPPDTDTDTVDTEPVDTDTLDTVDTEPVDTDTLDTDDTEPVDTDTVDTEPVDTDLPDQLPPEGASAMGAWLATGAYLGWACEPAPHPARPPGAHGDNRICSNAALSAATGPGDYPVGAASVKELYDRGGALSGYAVAVRVLPTSTGEGWYWYEILGSSVVADGRGDAGTPKSVCVRCHNGAPRDQVFTQVVP